MRAPVTGRHSVNRHVALAELVRDRGRDLFAWSKR